jgi:hypothetical protein
MDVRVRDGLSRVLAAVHADVESGDRVVFILDSLLAVVK